MLVELLENLGKDILIALLGAGVMWLLQQLIRNIQNRRLQKRYPLAGEFITKFEDEVDGVKITTATIATLKQEGRRILGSTHLDEREWIMEGELSEDGYVHGIYHPVNPLDKGLGNFFLVVQEDRSMSGMWSGFDSVNGKVTSGEYTFMPKLTGINYDFATTTDKVDLLRVADRQLGDGYVDPHSLDPLIERQAGFAVVARIDGHVIGFALCPIVSPDAVADLAQVPLPKYMSHADEVGVIKTVAVLPEHAGKGVGSGLVRICIREMVKQGVRALFSVAWKQPDGTVNISGVLKTSGFMEFGEVRDYWKDDSLADGFFCPACEEPPCRCSAVMFAKLAHSDEG